MSRKKLPAVRALAPIYPPSLTPAAVLRRQWQFGGRDATAAAEALGAGKDRPICLLACLSCPSVFCLSVCIYLAVRLCVWMSVCVCVCECVRVSA